MTRNIASAILSAIVMFCLAGLFNGVLAKEFIQTHVNASMLRETPNLALIFIGYLLLATLMVLAYRKATLPVLAPMKRGLTVGLAFAVIWLVPYSLVLFSVYRFPYEALAIDLPWALVEQGLGGLVIGLMQGKRAYA
ncbi:hypothetical protein [Thermomonas sp. HDW16]|uniref:hypothetical protein n=1 Tax=Thermomonas sp. HDW16 TaxID=2714945 RepID=UPI00140E611D|nr:hypothetical protein [Thermomonas sp. HDW16]QIL21089.1 hypothetical protein G7079_10320 [Thermomonas sp. HDW16]